MGDCQSNSLLGWAINGSLRSGDGSQRSCPAVHANRISIVKLEELLVSHYNQEFNEKAPEEEHRMSIEDKKFVEIMDKSVCVQDSHYCMDLPFNKYDIIMPNNRCIVEQRMQGLKRRLDRNKQYKEEYTAFLTDEIDKGYAEVVPYEQLEPKTSYTQVRFKKCF